MGEGYTLFTQKIFLQRPKANEIEEFLDNIIKNKKEFENIRVSGNVQNIQKIFMLQIQVRLL